MRILALRSINFQGLQERKLAWPAEERLLRVEPALVAVTASSLVGAGFLVGNAL